MAGSAFKDPAVVATLASFQPVLVADEDPRFDEVASKYGLRGFPTVVFTKADGTEVGRVLGAAPPHAFEGEAKKALEAVR